MLTAFYPVGTVFRFIPIQSLVLQLRLNEALVLIRLPREFFLLACRMKQINKQFLNIR